MRIALVALFASLAFCYGHPAYAQENTDAQRLHDAAFEKRPYTDVLHAPLVPYNAIKVGGLTIEHAYSLRRTAESWRVPESGQNVTQTQYEFRMYAEDHPLIKVGVHALMRSGQHSDASSNRYAVHFGREPDEQKVMIDLMWLFDRKK